MRRLGLDLQSARESEEVEGPVDRRERVEPKDALVESRWHVGRAGEVARRDTEVDQTSIGENEQPARLAEIILPGAPKDPHRAHDPFAGFKRIQAQLTLDDRPRVAGLAPMGEQRELHEHDEQRERQRGEDEQRAGRKVSRRPF